jgi:uracil-DNA glycosylase
LWGASAKELSSHFAEEKLISSPHPSPLSAYRGFFGSRPFTRANQILLEEGKDPIDWRL